MATLFFHLLWQEKDLGYWFLFLLLVFKDYWKILLLRAKFFVTVKNIYIHAFKGCGNNDAKMYMLHSNTIKQNNVLNNVKFELGILWLKHIILLIKHMTKNKNIEEILLSSWITSKKIHKEYLPVFSPST